MSILNIKDENGNWISVPAIKGDTGATGPVGPAGPQGAPGTGATVVQTTGNATDKVMSQKAVTDAFVQKGTIKSANLFNKSDVTMSEYLQGYSVVSGRASYGHSNWIHLTPGNYICMGSVITYGAAGRLIQYSNDGINVSTFSYASDVSDGLITFTVATEIYIRFNITQATLDTVMLVSGSQASDYPSEYIAYYEYLAIESNVRFNSYMSNDIDLRIRAYPLNGKKLIVNGDSICYGGGYLGGYAKIISDDFGMGYQNIAISGGTIAANTYFSSGSARHWICRTMSNLSNYGDYILIEGGVNDASLGVPLGSITSDLLRNLDDTTFYGAVESIFKYLTKNYTGKKYGFIIPHYMTAGMYFGGDYHKAIIECGEKWGVPVLDLSTQIPPFNLMRGADAELVAIRNEYTLNGDGWHPTEKGYRNYYVDKIVSWMKTL